MSHTEHIATNAGSKGLDGQAANARSGFSAGAIRAAANRWAGSTKTAARQTDAFLHEHPWLAVGAGALFGVAAGVAYSAYSRISSKTDLV